MEKLLEKFDSTLRKYNPVNYDALQPPLPQAEVEVYMRKWGIEDDNLRQLLCWKNGFDFRRNIHNAVIDWGAFLSVNSIDQHFHNDYPINSYIVKGGKRLFIPLTENGSGDTLLYNLQEQESGRIHLFSVALLYIDEPISYYDSLVTMIETEIAAYETEAYQVDLEEGWLDVDEEKLFSLAKKLNTKSDYWKRG